MFKTIRYLGSKEKLLAEIIEILAGNDVGPGRAFDAFAGSARVSWALREAGHEVIACDTLALSGVLQARALTYQGQPSFTVLVTALGLRVNQHCGGAAAAVLTHLNDLPALQSFVTREYSPSGLGNGLDRKYFTVQNAERIDAIRHAIHRYEAGGLVTPDERDYLLGCLIVAASERANTQGHTGAFLSEMQPNACLPLRLELPEHLPTQLQTGTAKRGDAAAVAATLRGLDLVYLDPPYNGRRYDSYYHVLERIAEGWFTAATPRCVGKTGQPAVRGDRSPWCGRNTAPAALASFLNAVDARHLLMSYSSAGLLDSARIEKALRARGIPDTYSRSVVEHSEYRGDANRGGGTVEESLYYIRLS
jgi:adenine-specific DNA-methyltransferase